MNRNSLLLSLIFIFMSITSNAEVQTSSTAVISDSSNKILLGKHIGYFEDINGDLSLNTLIKNNYKKQFNKSDSDALNFGLTKSTYWFHLKIFNTSVRENFFIESVFPLTDHIDLYYSDKDSNTYSYKNNSVSLKYYHHKIGGDFYPFDKREINSRTFVFPINIKSQEEKEIFIRMKSSNPMIAGFIFWSEKEYFANENESRTLYGLYYGIMLIIILYNFILFFTVRDKSHLLFVLYILSLTLYHSIRDGFAYEYLWPDSPWLSNKVPVFISFILIWAVWFTKEILNTKKFMPKFNRLIKYILIIIVLNFLTSFFAERTISLYINIILVIILAVIFSFPTFFITKQGYRPARFYLAAWTIPIIFIFIITFHALGIISTTYFHAYAMHIGSIIQGIVFSLALADKINILKQQKSNAQAWALTMEKEAAQNLRKEVNRQTKELKIRNSEAEKAKENALLVNLKLEQANFQLTENLLRLKQKEKELNNTFKQLETANNRMISQARMAVIGKMVSGVTHEIGNPLNSTMSGAESLAEFITETEELLNKNIDISQTETHLKDLNSRSKRAIKLINNGNKRMRRILDNLRSYIKAGKVPVEYYNFKNGLDSCLMLLKNRIDKQNITIETKIEKLPDIRCRAGEINQVVTNLLINSLDVMPDGGKISIFATYSNGNVKIQFNDTGPGIAEENRSYIFDPFFTTKETSKGTGLGLHISYEIIKQHDGEIKLGECVNCAQFHISIPTEFEEKL